MKETDIDFDRYIIYEDGRIFSKAKNDFMEETPNVHGYIQNNYKLKDGSSSRISRHRVIWTYFNGEIPKELEIDHINTIKTDCSLNNLILVSRKDNLNNPLTLVNMSNAQKGKHHTEEAKKKMSEQRQGENHPMYGKRHSENSKVKNRLSQKNKKPVAQIDVTTGNYIKIWESIREIESSLGFSHSHISRCCNGKLTTSYGFKWSFV